MIHELTADKFNVIIDNKCLPFVDTVKNLNVTTDNYLRHTHQV